MIWWSVRCWNAVCARPVSRYMEWKIVYSFPKKWRVILWARLELPSILTIVSLLGMMDMLQTTTIYLYGWCDKAGDSVQWLLSVDIPLQQEYIPGKQKCRSQHKSDNMSLSGESSHNIMSIIVFTEISRIVIPSHISPLEYISIILMKNKDIIITLDKI